MSHTLTETATFDATIVVPDGSDSGANRAGDVELIAQRLANRSRALKAITDNAAVKNVANTFTASNTFTGGLTANAVTVTGDLDVDGNADVLGGDFRVIAGNLRVDSAHDVLYMGTVVTVHKQISISRGSPGGVGDFNITLQSDGYLENFGAANEGNWFVPIDIPSGCQLVDAHILYNGGAADNAFDFNVRRQTITDWGATPAGGPTSANIGTGASSLAGLHTAACSLGNYTVNNANETYFLRIICYELFADGQIFGFRVGFTNYGLNNR
jgi:hypothetical protein